MIRLRKQIALAVLVASSASGALASTAFADNGDRSDHSVGAVYTLSNSPNGNEILAFGRAADGTLTAQGAYATDGVGTGAGLGSQGALALDGDHLFAVNAASNSISEFKVRDHRLSLEATVASGGATPISLTVHDHLLYVLNAGDVPNITSFRVESHHLLPIAGSTRALSAGAAGPAQVSFSPDGDVLVVTEKSSNTIDTFRVGRKGLAGHAVASPSAGAVPFGFDFDRHGHVVVSNAS
ncbi:MAG: 3-carboxymuconate cyclase, partial [Ilumatobacteraceae bacterium]